MFAVTGEYKPEGEEDEGNTNNNANTDYDEGRSNRQIPRYKSSIKYKLPPKPLTGQLVMVVYGDQGKTGLLPMTLIGDQPTEFVSGQTVEFQVIQLNQINYFNFIKPLSF